MEENQKIAMQIAEELNVKVIQVVKTIELIDGGNTIPFIARYRKEVTRRTFWWNFKGIRRKTYLPS